MSSTTRASTTTSSTSTTPSSVKVKDEEELTEAPLQQDEGDTWDVDAAVAVDQYYGYFMAFRLDFS